MIVSNEPGYYKTGEYGIRIENLVSVTGSESDLASALDSGSVSGSEKALDSERSWCW
jgi:Xaa-Pro aminopeptidase